MRKCSVVCQAIVHAEPLHLEEIHIEENIYEDDASGISSLNSTDSGDESHPIYKLERKKHEQQEDDQDPLEALFDDLSHDHGPDGNGIHLNGILKPHKSGQTELDLKCFKPTRVVSILLRHYPMHWK